MSEHCQNSGISQGVDSHEAVGVLPAITASRPGDVEIVLAVVFVAVAVSSVLIANW